MTTTTREDIARVVDPGIWDEVSQWYHVSDWTRRRSEALAKADCILALIAGEGWRVVPVEPTPAMLTAWEGACPDAGWEALQDMSDEDVNAALCRAEWSAMLAAAPTAEDAKEVEA